MAGIKDFRELMCWQLARELVKDVYSLTRVGLFAKDYGLKDQIQRAVVSIGSNIAEGFERGSNQEFAKFLSYAKGLAAEVISQLYAALDVGYITEIQHTDLVNKLKSLGAIVAKLQTSLKQSTIQGLYYKPVTPNPHTPETLTHINSKPYTRNHKPPKPKTIHQKP